VKKLLFPLYFGLLLLVSLYVGIASNKIANFKSERKALLKDQDSLLKIGPGSTIALDKIEFSTAFEQKYAQLSLDYERRPVYLPDMDLNDALLLLSVSWGCIGGLIRLLIDALYEKKNRRKYASYLIPLLSCVTGLVTYCITYYTPALLFKNEINYDPGYFMYAALLGGIFTKNIYDKLQTSL
jgi:hypothetical protein